MRGSKKVDRSSISWPLFIRHPFCSYSFKLHKHTGLQARIGETVGWVQISATFACHVEAPLLPLYAKWAVVPVRKVASLTLPCAHLQCCTRSELRISQKARELVKQRVNRRHSFGVLFFVSLGRIEEFLPGRHLVFLVGATQPVRFRFPFSPFFLALVASLPQVSAQLFNRQRAPRRLSE